MFTPFGLDISDLSLKLVSLRKKSKQIQLVSFNQIKVPEGYFINGEIKEQEKIVELIKKLIKTVHGKKIKTPYVISVLPEAKTFIKLIEVPKSSNNEITSQIIEEELKHHIPFSQEEIYYDWQKMTLQRHSFASLRTSSEDPDGTSGDEGSRKIKVLVTAVSKKLAEKYSLLLKNAGLKLLVLEPEPVAICRALLKEKYSEEGVIILDLGATRSSITVFDQETIQFTMSIPISGQKITQTISEKLKITYQEAEKMKFVFGFEEKKSNDFQLRNVNYPRKSASLSAYFRGTSKRIYADDNAEKRGKDNFVIQDNDVLKEILSSVTEELIKKIEEARSFYKEDHQLPNHRKIIKILLCGGGANFKGIEKILSQRLNLEVEKGDPLWQIALPKNLSLPPSEALTYTTAIGLGLRGMESAF